MNRGLYYASNVAFLALPVLLLAARHRLGARLPWFLVVLLLALCGWVLFNASVYFHFEHLCKPFGEDMWSVPPELEERFLRCTGDGGRRVFALYAGWLVGLVYATPFLAAYALAARRR